MPPVPTHCLEDLDLFAACGLAALVQSRDLHRPVTPTKSMTVRVLEALHERGIVEVPWPKAQWELPPRGYLAPLEQLGWDYIWPAIELGGLGHAIEARLHDRLNDELDDEQCVEVWRALVQAESVEYFEFQLAKHGMERSWSADLAWLPRRYQDDLSLGRWKYLIWSAVRHGAMVSRASNCDDPLTRAAISAMLTNPQRLGITLRGDFDGFLPASPRPFSLMAQVFVRSAARLGLAYWSYPPSVWGLKEGRRSA